MNALSSAITLFVALTALVLVPGCGDDSPVRTLPTTGCIDFGDYVRYLSAADTPGETRRAARNGNITYAADGTSGVQVIDIRDPAAPVITSTIATPGEATDVVVDGSRLYVATRRNGVQLYDVSVPSTPLFTGGLSTSGQAMGMAVADTLLYVANDGLGLQVISVQDPSSPRQIGTENTPGEAQDVVVSGDYAYVSDAVLGLRVISIADPAGPVLVDTLVIPGQPRGLAIREQTVYVASVSAGLQVVDVSEPFSTSIVRGVPMPGGVTDVDIQDERAYTADRFSGVHILDLAVADDPEVLTSVGLPGEAIGVNAAGDLLLASAPRAGVSTMGLKFIGIENPNPPPIVSTRPTPDPIGQALGVFLVGEALYVCDGPAGVQIVDAADPRLPVFVDNIPLVGARHVSVHESVAYVAGENTVLQLDVRDPFAPLILSASMPGAERVAANDSLVFLAQGRADVAVYRVTSPGGPEFAQRIGATGGIFAFDVAVSGSYAYVSWGTAGLQVIEIDRIGTPAPPVVASLATSGAAKGIAISGQHAVVAVTSGLEVIDIQLPTAPVLNGLLGAPGNSSFVTVSGSTAYLASGLVGVHVISIRDPMKPTITGSLNSGGTVLGVAADRFFAYVVDRDDGLVVTAAQCED